VIAMRVSRHRVLNLIQFLLWVRSLDLRNRLMMVMLRVRKQRNATDDRC
jgi:hypothetical protein